jgi:UDP-glucose:(heptosyl)LPS alpha-1,3-glucosyltransferase
MSLISSVMMQQESTQRRIAIAGRSIRDASGSSRIILGLTRALAGAGHTVDVFAENINRALVREHGGNPRSAAPWYMQSRLTRPFFDRLALSSAATRRIRRGSYDIVVGNGTLLEQTVLMMHNVVRREAEVLGPSETPLHDEIARLQERVLGAGAFRLIVANSMLMADELRARYGPVADRLVVIHPGIDPQQFQPLANPAEREALRRQLGVEPGQRLVGFITSGNYRLRGADILADTIAQLPGGLRENVRALALASPKNAEIITSEFAARGLASQLIVRNKTQRVQDYYHSLDLLVHPARFETFGLVVSEAAACGCPVLTSTSVGAAELFSGPARLGVVDEPSAAQFVQPLARLLEDTSMLATLRDAQLMAVRLRTWSTCVEELLTALRSRGLVT